MYCTLAHFLLDYAVTHTSDFLLEIPVPRTEDEKKKELLKEKKRQTQEQRIQQKQEASQGMYVCVKVINARTVQVR